MVDTLGKGEVDDEKEERDLSAPPFSSPSISASRVSDDTRRGRLEEETFFPDPIDTLLALGMRPITVPSEEERRSHPPREEVEEEKEEEEEEG